MEELKLKLIKLKELLKERENDTYTFFENLIKKINENDLGCLDLLLEASTIVQYGDFTHKEESLFREIWYLAEKLRGK